MMIYHSRITKIQKNTLKFREIARRKSITLFKEHILLGCCFNQSKKVGRKYLVFHNKTQKSAAFFSKRPRTFLLMSDIILP